MPMLNKVRQNNKRRHHMIHPSMPPYTQVRIPLRDPARYDVDQTLPKTTLL